MQGEVQGVISVHRLTAVTLSVLGQEVFNTRLSLPGARFNFDVSYYPSNVNIVIRICRNVVSTLSRIGTVLCFVKLRVGLFYFPLCFRIC